MFQLFIMSRERRKQLVQNNKPFLRCTSHLYQSSVDSTLMNYSTDACVFLACQFPTKHNVSRNLPYTHVWSSGILWCFSEKRTLLQTLQSWQEYTTFCVTLTSFSLPYVLKHAMRQKLPGCFQRVNNVSDDGVSKNKCQRVQFTQTPCYAVFRQSLG